MKKSSEENQEGTPDKFKNKFSILRKEKPWSSYPWDVVKLFLQEPVDEKIKARAERFGGFQSEEAKKVARAGR